MEAPVALYRRDFQPAEQLAEPYVIAGAGVIAAATEDEARRRLRLGLQLLSTAHDAGAPPGYGGAA